MSKIDTSSTTVGKPIRPIWIVEDDPSIRFVLEKALLWANIPSRSFVNCSDVMAALRVTKSTRPTTVTEKLWHEYTDTNEFGVIPPQVVLTDIRMPNGSGWDVLAQMQRQYPKIPVIVMTAYSDLDSAVASFQGGAFEYLPKPFDVRKAIELIQRAVTESVQSDKKAIEQENEVVTNTQKISSDGQQPSSLARSNDEMLGQAPAMQEVFRAIGRLSQSNVTVMITGESGTGKELVARALHKHSPRGKFSPPASHSNTLLYVAGTNATAITPSTALPSLPKIHREGPFIAINTAAIPKDLLESELFGHEKGAFTGAQTLYKGRFEQADGGTLFLDEIGDMPFELQTRLLRVLSDGHFYRVGGHVAVKTNVRVIAATHQNLEQQVQMGGFREDLYHRLNVIRLRLPPLRERVEDIPLLTRYFLLQSAKQLGCECKIASDAALMCLSTFTFSGNVRQLENICHWLTVMAPSQYIEVKDLPAEVLATAAQHAKTENDGNADNNLAQYSSGYKNWEHELHNALLQMTATNSNPNTIQQSIKNFELAFQAVLAPFKG